MLCFPVLWKNQKPEEAPLQLPTGDTMKRRTESVYSTVADSWLDALVTASCQKKPVSEKIMGIHTQYKQNWFGTPCMHSHYGRNWLHAAPLPSNPAKPAAGLPPLLAQRPSDPAAAAPTPQQAQGARCGEGVRPGARRPRRGGVAGGDPAPRQAPPPAAPESPCVRRCPKRVCRVSQRGANEQPPPRWLRRGQSSVRCQQNPAGLLPCVRNAGWRSVSSGGFFA